MTSPNTQSAAWHAWATERLGVPADASITDARLAFLATLETSDLVSSTELRTALQLREACDKLKGLPGRALIEFRKSQTKELRRAVEAFAQRYWSVAPAQRRVEYAQLFAQASRIPLVGARLKSLCEGLAIEAVPDGAGDAVQDLARQIQEMYVLRSLDRAVRRHELAESLCCREGETNLERVYQEYLNTAHLEPDLWRRTTEISESRAAEAEVSADAVAKSRTRSAIPVDAQPNSQPQVGNAGKWIGGIILLICSFMCVLFTLQEDTKPRLPRSSGGQVYSADDLRLKIIHVPGDESPKVVAVDKNGKVVPVGMATMKLLGMDKLLKDDAEKRAGRGPQE